MGIDGFNEIVVRCYVGEMLCFCLEGVTNGCLAIVLDG